MLKNEEMMKHEAKHFKGAGARKQVRFQILTQPEVNTII